METLYKILMKVFSWLEKRAADKHYNSIIKNNYIKRLRDEQLTIVENSSESRIAAMKKSPITFIRNAPKGIHIEDQFNIHGSCDPIMKIGLIEKIEAIYPEYGNLHPLQHSDFYEREFLNEDGGIRNDRAIALKAMFSIVGHRSYLPKRFQSDAEMLFCMILACDFSISACSNHFDITKYEFITEDMTDGSGFIYDSAEAIDMLHEIVVAQRPIKAFYELLRPKLRMTYPELDRRDREAFDAVYSLPNFNSVMDECVMHEDEKLRNNYSKLKSQLLSNKFEDALPEKMEPKKKIAKI